MNCRDAGISPNLTSHAGALRQDSFRHTVSTNHHWRVLVKFAAAVSWDLGYLNDSLFGILRVTGRHKVCEEYTGDLAALRSDEMLAGLHCATEDRQWWNSLSAREGRDERLSICSILSR
jgi:hypothetical protein